MFKSYAKKGKSNWLEHREVISSKRCSGAWYVEQLPEEVKGARL